MSRCISLLIWALSSVAASGVAEAQPRAANFRWSSLPALPDPEGFAGMYAGHAGEMLLAAGGTQFANGVPSWEGGTKLWSDTICVLRPNHGQWQKAVERLPRPLGDGAAVSHGDELICIGGGDARQAFADVFALRVRGGHVDCKFLPSLPSPCLKMAAAIIDDVIYVTGGRDDPNSRETLHTFWALDLSRPPKQQRWESLAPWPGPSRMMPILAVSQKALFLFGGIEVAPDAGGRPTNQAPYLSDAYRFDPGSKPRDGTWSRVRALPGPLAGSPSPAFVVADKEIYIFGGVDGAIEAIPQAKRGSVTALPGDIYRFKIAQDIWDKVGLMPADTIRVNAPAFAWHGEYIIISGEHLPSRRTNACTVVEYAGPQP